MRNLDQEARAVAGVVFTSTCTTMVHIYECRDAVADDLMRFPSFQVDDEAHCAAIVFVSAGRTDLGLAVDLGASFACPADRRLMRPDWAMEGRSTVRHAPVRCRAGSRAADSSDTQVAGTAGSPALVTS